MAKLEATVKNKIISELQKDINDEQMSDSEYESLARVLEYQASILTRPVQIVTSPTSLYKPQEIQIQNEQNSLASTFRTFASTLRRMAAQEREHRANLNGLLAEIQRKSQYV